MKWIESRQVLAVIFALSTLVHLVSGWFWLYSAIEPTAAARNDSADNEEARENVSNPTSTVAPNNSSWAETFRSSFLTASDYLYRVSESLEDFSSRASVCEQMRCANGSLPVRNTSVEIEPNGCGSYGILLPRRLSTSVSECCDEHDICYAACGIRRSRCDEKFANCTRDVCDSIKRYAGSGSTFNDSFNRAIRSMGCPAFVNSQASHCFCHEYS